MPCYDILATVISNNILHQISDTYEYPKILVMSYIVSVDPEMVRIRLVIRFQNQREFGCRMMMMISLPHAVLRLW